MKQMNKRILCGFLTAALTATAAFGNPASYAAQGIWKKAENTWHFENAQGIKQTGWIQDGGAWYYLDSATGEMKTGWLKLGNRWYFFSNTNDAAMGRMLTGWQWIDGYSYYFQDGKSEPALAGALLTDAITPDGYRVNADGRWIDEAGSIHHVPNKGYSSLGAFAQAASAADKKTAVRGGSSAGGGRGGSGGGSGASSRSFGGGSGISSSTSGRTGAFSESASGSASGTGSTLAGGSASSDEHVSVNPDTGGSLSGNANMPNSQKEQRDAQGTGQSSSANDAASSASENHSTRTEDPQGSSGSTAGESSGTSSGSSTGNTSGSTNDAVSSASQDDHNSHSIMYSTNHTVPQGLLHSDDANDILINEKTKLINLGYAQYVTIAFANGTIDDYDVYIDGTRVNDALSNVSDDGKLVKWATTVVSPKMVKAVKSDGREESVRLASGNALQTPEVGSLDSAPKYVLTHGPISIFDYHLSEHGADGAERELPDKTTFTLNPTAPAQDPLNTLIPTDFFIPAVKIDDRGRGISGQAVVIKTSIKTDEQRAWFNQIHKIRLLRNEDNVQLLSSLTYSAEIQQGRFGEVGVITIPTPQENMRSRGTYKVNIRSLHSAHSVTVPFTLVTSENFVMYQSTETMNPKVGEDVLFSLEGSNGSSFGTEIRRVIQKVVLTKPNGVKAVLKNIKEYSIIGGSLHIYGKDNEDTAKVLTDQVGIYELSVYADGYPKITKKFEINAGRSFVQNQSVDTDVVISQEAENIIFENDIQNEEMDAVTSASLSLGGGSSSGSSGSGSGSSGGGAIQGTLVFNYDLMVNAVLLNELELLNADASTLMQRYFTQVPKYVFAEGAPKFYSYRDFFDKVQEERIQHGRSLNFAEYAASAEEAQNYHGPSQVQMVLENGKLGKQLSFGYLRGNSIEADDTGTTVLEGQDFKLNFGDEDHDYLSKITRMTMDGSSTALRSDAFLRQYRIDLTEKKLNIYRSAFPTWRSYVGEHILTIEATGYQTKNITLTVKSLEENVELTLLPKSGSSSQQYETGEDVHIRISEDTTNARGDFLNKLSSVKLEGSGIQGLRQIYPRGVESVSSPIFYVKNQENGANYLTIKSGFFTEPGVYKLYLRATGYPAKSISFRIQGEIIGQEILEDILLNSLATDSNAVRE